MLLLTLKIGRNSYDITEKDKFMYNDACVQLLTQSKEVNSWGKAHNPVLSKRAIKEISGFRHESHAHGYGSDVLVFSLNA